MTTILCPRCTEVLNIPDKDDYGVCPRCGNTIFVLNIIEEEQKKTKKKIGKSKKKS